MLHRELLSKALNDQRDDFVSFAATQNGDLEVYLKVLDDIARHSSAQVAAKIADCEDVGAIPSGELDGRRSFLVDFGEIWENHEQARRWALEVLKNRTTFAADASQILPGRDISLPVAAIQVGWFENPHNNGSEYEKNADFRLLSPKELLEDQQEPMNPATRVGEFRFHAEVDRVRTFLEKKEGWQARGERMPLAFFDGTLLVSFPLPQTTLKRSFVEKMVELVRLSDNTGVPLVGYVDQSYSCDLLNLIETFDPSSVFGNRTLYDAAILRGGNSNRILEKWGDRSVFCYSKRQGLNAFIDRDTGRSLVGFTYLQTTADGLPARIDVPAWIYQQGLVDEVLDTIRAECVVGLGYPYALETADATAVISGREREIFLGALQEFANREKLNFSVSRKSASKGRRR